ncbi:MAG: efflux RND transporter periplasmic adaptor subunit [Panacagrimonas sp.]
MNTNIQILAASIAALVLAGCGDTASPAGATNPSGPGGHREASAGEAGQHADTHDDLAIPLSDAQIQAAGITVLTVQPARIRETLSLYGVITPNVERTRQVSARFPGAIQSVSAKVGEAVHQGQVLAVIESNESLRSYPLTAPLAGVITERNANPGEQAGSNALFTVADLSTVWVELSLFPRDVAKVRIGQAVRIRGADAPLPGDGRVVYLAPFGSATSQTLSARVLVDNVDRRWAPGLYVTADVTLSEAIVPLTIHNEAVQSLEGRTVVFVRRAAGFEPQAVQLGRRDGERTEVRSGLAAGDAYAAANSFILKAELGKGSAGHGH